MVQAGRFYTLLGCWALGFVFTTWWVIALWTGGGIFYAGPKACLIIWSVPTSPLFVLTWYWLRRRQAAPRPLLWIVAIGWIMLLLAPNPPTPTFSFNNETGYRTFVSPWFTATLLSLTALPIVASLGMIVAVVRARNRPPISTPAA
jgi:hypothetical protein